jgi:hypothetical protein
MNLYLTSYVHLCVCVCVFAYIFYFLFLYLLFVNLCLPIYLAVHTFSNLFICASIHIIHPPNHTSVFVDVFKFKFIPQSIHL